MSKYPKTIVYRDANGQKVSVEVLNEVEEKVLNNEIEKNIKLNASVKVEKEIFNMRMSQLDELDKQRDKAHKKNRKEEEERKKKQNKAFAESIMGTPEKPKYFGILVSFILFALFLYYILKELILIFLN